MQMVRFCNFSPAQGVEALKMEGCQQAPTVRISENLRESPRISENLNFGHRRWGSENLRESPRISENLKMFSKLFIPLWCIMCRINQFLELFVCFDAVSQMGCTHLALFNTFRANVSENDSFVVLFFSKH